MKKGSCLLGLLLLLFCLPTVLAAEPEPFRPGDRVVIWMPEKGVALSSQKSGSFLAKVSVTQSGGVLTGFSDTEVWTVEQGEGGWRFTQNGQALSLNQNALALDGALDTWLLEGDGEACRMKNAGINRYLSYNSSKKYWTIATSGTKIAFYVLPGEEEPTLPPETPPPEYGGKYLYFGQLHAHTDLSDGTGSVEEAFSYASNVPGLDFFAVTDHSQNFDGGEAASLTGDARDYSDAWARGKAAAAAVTDGSFVGLFGFEMTWNQGQGHISTFATPGFLSREQAGYEDYAGGMEAYYDALVEAETSISQFNHPGSTYGDFKGFSSCSPALDQRITLIEVGEDLSAYDRALSLGWHLAPTNNQNNHAGKWGDETDARTVVLAGELTEQAIYDALANYRVYATQDRDLQIYFTANGYEMGSEIPTGTLGGTITLSAQLHDPTDENVGDVKVEVVSENGLILAETTLPSQSGTVRFTLPANRDYYYLRITQPDGDWAVTAPVWLDDQKDYGIAGIRTATPVTTAGEDQKILVELYNNEKTPLTVTSVTLTAEGIHTGDSGGAVEAFGEGVWEFSHTFGKDGVYPVTAKVTVNDRGQERQFVQSLSITVMPPKLIDRVVVDGSHGNGEPVERAQALAESKDVALVVETGPFTSQTLADCRCLIIPAPRTPLQADFIELVADFAAGGGTVILCGTSAEENPDAAPWLNGLLEAMGSTLRLNADTVRDDIHNGGGPTLLYTMNYGESPWLEGVTGGQRYYQNFGCSVSGGEALVRGQSSAYGGFGEAPALLTAEKLDAGNWVFVSGDLFLSDEHIEEMGDAWALPRANQTILETVLELNHSPQAVIPIQELRRAEPGRIYLAEGRVTAGTANPNTTFANTIYIQDTTGGIAAVNYSTHGLALGTRVRILGVLGSDGENSRLEILRLNILEQEDLVTPEQAGFPLSREGGWLLQIQGRVVSRELMDDGMGVSRFLVEDEAGNRTAVLIDGNIRSGSRGKNELSRQTVPGDLVSVVGISHISAGEPVLRLRDCDEVRLLDSPDWQVPDAGEEEDAPGADTGEPDSGDPDGTGPDGENGGSPENDNPNTGQQGSIPFYAALMLLSALALGLLQRKSRPG